MCSDDQLLVVCQGIVLRTAQDGQLPCVWLPTIYVHSVLTVCMLGCQVLAGSPQMLPGVVL
jgi:hypothetical protein